MSLRRVLLKSWHKPTILTWLLWPLSQVYRALFELNRMCFRLGLRQSYRAPIPVIVVGNITVGGTGKTPLVIHLAESLRSRGYHPGVISRGYHGESSRFPLLVEPTTPASESGDEPALIARRTGVPVCVGPNRQASIKRLINDCEVDVIISDDGLQHSALQRDLEICLVDHTSLMKNPYLLPAGPLREPLTRLTSVDMVVHHAGESEAGFTMTLSAAAAKPLVDQNSNQFDYATRVFAVAGIGNPQRFFDTCTDLGLTIEPHAFPDHHQFSPADIDFDGQVLMTEKDAVKCTEFADERHWYLPVAASLNSDFDSAVIAKLQWHNQDQRVTPN